MFLLCLLVLVGITGCATTPTLAPPGDGPVSGVTAWEFEGRAVMRQGKRSWRVDMRWQQHADDYQISLMSLLGQQLARLYGRRGEVILQRPDQAAVRAGGPAELLAREFGWDIPVQGLRYWVLGNAAPDTVSSGRRDQYGYYRVLDQQGWHIVFDRYQLVENAWLPGRLALERDGLKVKLVIDHWHLTGRDN